MGDDAGCGGAPRRVPRSKAKICGTGPGLDRGEGSAVRLSERLWRIPTLPLDLLNSFAFVEDDGSVTLVDCGLRRAPAQIVAGLVAIGKAPGDVQRIVLTHAHIDHAGGLAEVRSRAGDPPVHLHEAEARFVREGISPPPDTSLTVGRLMARGPDQRFTPVRVGRELHDGDVLPVAGGLRVIHTPGHTPGHVSLLHEPDGVLITRRLPVQRPGHPVAVRPGVHGRRPGPADRLPAGRRAVLARRLHPRPGDPRAGRPRGREVPA